MLYLVNNNIVRKRRRIYLKTEIKENALWKTTELRPTEESSQFQRYYFMQEVLVYIILIKRRRSESKLS